MIAALMIGAVLAARPDTGAGIYAFDSADTIMYVDGPTGTVRVHYSAQGPNVTLMADDDKDGRPDYPFEVAVVAEDVLAFYASLGFLAPIKEAEMGLGELGGSPGFDFYLVDFGGGADGLFSIDACAGRVCSGFMVIENDFAGYGYSSISEAVRVLTSHELFHAVQAAYNAGQPPWLSEGTAVWAEHQYDPKVDDFIWFCNQYLKDLGRPVDSPPAGMITAFSYGTALFFQFLTERFGEGIGPDIQQAMEGLDDEEMMPAIADTIETYGGVMRDEWVDFTRWNLATGARAGAVESYSFAERLRLIDAELEGDLIQDDNRFYPLAATYYTLQHPGGEVSFATLDDPGGLAFSLHPLGEDGQIFEPVDAWEMAGPGLYTLGDLDPGEYWMIGTLPTLADQSQKIEFCLGEADWATACLPTAEDTGDSMPPSMTEPSGCTGRAVLLPLLLALGLRYRRLGEA